MPAATKPLPPHRQRKKNDATPEELTKYPWLAISKKFVKPGVSHDMEGIRESVARGWGH